MDWSGEKRRDEERKGAERRVETRRGEGKSKRESVCLDSSFSSQEVGEQNNNSS